MADELGTSAVALMPGEDNLIYLEVSSASGAAGAAEAAEAEGDADADAGDDDADSDQEDETPGGNEESSVVGVVSIMVFRAK